MYTLSPFQQVNLASVNRVLTNDKENSPGVCVCLCRTDSLRETTEKQQVNKPLCKADS